MIHFKLTDGHLPENDRSVEDINRYRKIFAEVEALGSRDDKGKCERRSCRIVPEQIYLKVKVTMPSSGVARQKSEPDSQCTIYAADDLALPFQYGRIATKKSAQATGRDRKDRGAQQAKHDKDDS
jgi:hypothetical protein